MLNGRKKFIINNKDENFNKNFISYKNKLYKRNNISDIEFSRITFLSELLNKDNLNINNLDIIESNKVFLNKIILPKLEKIKSNIKNNPLRISKINIDNNLFTDEKTFYNLKFLNYFTLMNKTWNKNKNLYQNDINKLINDFTFIYFPLADLIYEFYIYKNENNNNINNNIPLIIGLQAHQGCGKTTLSNIVSDLINNNHNMTCNCLSIDDVYKSHKELEEIKLINPIFEYRGPPGTHDLDVLYSIMNKIKARESNYYLPRYDKSLYNGSGDRNDFGSFVKSPIDILIFEGWFIGAKPLNNESDEEKLDKILEDNRYKNNEKGKNLLIQSNENLKEYVKYWEMIDFYISIKPEDFKLSRKWRIQEEKKNKNGMNWKTINKFIDYFWISLPPYFYLDNLESYSKPSVRIIVNKNRDNYI